MNKILGAAFLVSVVIIYSSPALSGPSLYLPLKPGPATLAIYSGGFFLARFPLEIELARGESNLVVADLPRTVEGDSVELFLPGVEILEKTQKAGPAQFIFKLAVARAGKYQGEMRYLASGLGWHSSYRLTLFSETRARLEGYAALANTTGASFEPAKLLLVAGDVRRRPVPGIRGREAEAREAVLATPVQEEAAFEYHLYDFPLPLELGEGNKELPLFSPRELAVTRRYVFAERRALPLGEGRSTPPEGVNVLVTLLNEAPSGPGMPLPAGSVAVYQVEEDRVIFVGQEGIGHTPKGARVEVAVGRSFDIQAKKAILGVQTLPGRTRDVDFEVVVTNAKTMPVEVEVIQEIVQAFGEVQVEVLRASHRYGREGGRYIFLVPVESQGRASLRYSLRIKQP